MDMGKVMVKGMSMDKGMCMDIRMNILYSMLCDIKHF